MREPSPYRIFTYKEITWLHLNLVTAFLAASVVALFEGIIAKIPVLAVFLPIVAGQGSGTSDPNLWQL